MKSIGDSLPSGSRGVLMTASILGCYFLIRLSVSYSSEERSVLIHSLRCIEEDLQLNEWINTGDLMAQKIQVGRNRTWSRSLVFKLYHIVGLTCCLVAKSCPTLATPWRVTQQVPLTMGFPRHEYWSRLSFSSPGDLLKDWTVSPVLVGGFFTLSQQGSPRVNLEKF